MNNRRNLLLVMLVSIFSVPAFSAWTEPEPVSAVNTDYTEWSPFLSFDGLTLYFSRLRTSDSYYGRIYEAIRPESEGAFTTIRKVPGTLNSLTGQVVCPWVSPDNLRMYYHTEESGIGWKLRFSERVTTNDPWPAGTEISELNAMGTRLLMPRLTADELDIFFQAADRDGGQHDIWMASRAARGLPFSYVRNLSEINTLSNEGSPSMTSDGLTLYFMSNRNNGYEQIFRATRASRDIPFSNVEHLSFLDTEIGHSSHPCISADGKALYYIKNVTLGVTFQDIYVSYWVEDSYYVDANSGNDQNNGTSSQTAFATIQKAVDTAPDGYTIFVKPGTYSGNIDFKGKAITLQGVAGTDGVPVLESANGFAAAFYNNEGPDSVLKNFVIRNSFMGIFIAGSSPTIRNLTIVDNDYGIRAYSANPDISNCIFWNNSGSDIFGCQARYSLLQGQLEYYSPYQDISGLVHYWPIKEREANTINDIVSDKNGNIYGAAWTDGVTGSALSFDGIDDYVALPDNDPVWLPQNNFTVSVWVYFERDPDYPANEVILDLNYANSDNSSNELGYNILFFALNNPRQLAFQMHTITTNDEDLSSNAIIIPNQWYQITIVRNSTVQSMYINGQLSARRNCSPDPIKFVGGYDDDKVNIGRFTTTLGSPRYHFKGKLDEISIFNRALSSSEIEHLYSCFLDIVPDPLFADASNGDYHLKSKRGRYWPEHDIWVLDKVTSPGVDGGDSAASVYMEPVPNGGIINMGAYGGTAYASLSEKFQLEADFNKNGIIDESDLADLIKEWLSVSGWLE